MGLSKRSGKTELTYFALTEATSQYDDQENYFSGIISFINTN